MTAAGQEPDSGGWLASAPVRWVAGVLGRHSDAIVFGAKVGATLPALARVPAALRPLEARERLIALACLLLLALLVGATHLFSGWPELFARLTWSDGGGERALPRPALYLALAGWAVSGAVAVAAASRGHATLFVATGLIQVFAVTFAAFPAGKTYWLAAPTWVLAVLAAATDAPGRSRRGRAVATGLLCGLATWHTYLFTPLSAGGQPPAWGQLGALFALGLTLLLSLPRRLGPARAFALALAVNSVVLLQALRAGEPALARGLVLPASFLVGLFSVMWFVLGGELVSGAVSAANVALKVATRTVRRPFLPAAVLALCGVEVVAAPWLLATVDAQTGLALSLHRWLALALVVLGGILAVRRGLTPEWTRGLLAVWVFGLAALRAYFSEATELAAHADTAEAVTALALTLFTVTVAMQAVMLLIEKPEEGTGPHASLLLIQLGALAFLATGTHLQFAVGDTGVMREAAAYQFAGAIALFLPLLLALLLSEQRWRRAPPSSLLLHAFVAGFVAAFAVQLLRMATVGPGGWTLAGHLGAVALGEALKMGCIAVLVARGRTAGPVDMAAAAVACALGFAAGYAHDLVVLLLDAAGKIVMLLTVRSAAVNEGLAALVAGYVRMRPELPAADHYHLAVASLLPAAVMAWGVARALREGRPLAGGLGVLGGAAISLASAWVLHAHPLLMTESREPVPFYAVLADPGALLLLLAPVLGLAAWLYLTVWRATGPAAAPAPRSEHAGRAVASAPRGEHAGRAVASAPRGEHAGPAAAPGTTGQHVDGERAGPAGGPAGTTRAIALPALGWRARATWAVALPALGLAVLGVGLAARAEAPMAEYRDPEGRFVLDHPRGWRVERRPGGETRLFRDDPVHGTLLLVHPGIALPRRVSAAELLSWLEREARAIYPDVRLAASASPPRGDAERSVQRIDLTAAWTAPGGQRLRSASTIALVSTPAASRFSYVTYQFPETATAAQAAALARAARSYRAR